MAKTAGDVIVETLMEWGVDTIFGFPGDGIDGVIEALRKQMDKIKFIQVRHEEAAAFAACGYAKFTGRLGVCLATSGPGGIHLLNGLYDANMDGQPVLAITGMQFHDVIGTFSQQDVALDKLFDNCCLYSERVMGAAHARSVTELAIRTALARKGVCHITIPIDIQSQEVKDDERSNRNVKGHANSSAFSLGAVIPPEANLQAAAQILNAGKKLVILAGRGALGCGKQVEQLAELLGAPVIKPLLGKAVVSDTSPYTTGGLGLLGTKPSEDAMQECDTLFIIGAGFPYIEYYPKPGQAKCVQIEIEPHRLALRYPVDVPLVGDSHATLEKLIPLLKRNKHRGFLEDAQKGMKEWLKVMEERGTRKDVPMKPQVVAWELGKRLPNNAIVAGDSGANTTWWARQILAKEGQMHSCSGNLATMANGFPYAIAASVAYPDRPVIAWVGDGGFTMLMGEMATCMKYKLPIKVFLMKNDELAQIKWEQMVLLGNPEYVTGLQPIDFAAVARGFGWQGYQIRTPSEAGHIIDNALAATGPVMVECFIDPNEAPLPAKIKPEQAWHFAESMARGTKDWQKIAETIAKDKIKELV
ncbi:MAG TPA: thiamine pyrophosphate-dependent enzyme [Bryobacteraceae bacterium]|jgi:pyruvate dehydrogenase (quinone)/pyruvate oxidase|nr:thiamine pyrophosphate-dependent enzyme [Bryobacteraceae bacterium]